MSHSGDFALHHAFCGAAQALVILATNSYDPMMPESIKCGDQLRQDYA
jgi:hypothetical protein